MKCSYHLTAGILACYNVFSVLAQAPAAPVPAPTVVNPPCAICGCSFCPAGFLVGNPSGVIPVPPEFLNQAPPGLTQVPCSLLDFAGTSGQIPPDLCNDDLRLLPDFRSICGCPALPKRPTVAPVMAPMAPVAAPMAPVAAPMAPVAAPMAPVTAPMAPVTAPMAPVTAPMAPVTAPAAPVVPPVVAPVAMPVPAPKAAPTKPSKRYAEEIYYLSHPISSSYSTNSTIGSPWATVTDVMDGEGKAGFIHEYCARTTSVFWYCSGTFVDLFYRTAKSGRLQYKGHISFTGWFSDTSKDGVFTITGGTMDFIKARGHIFVKLDGATHRREIHASY